MRLINVTNEHIAQVIQRIDREGIPTNRIHNEYWLLIGGREYPFKLTMTYAMELAGEANTDIEQFRTGPYYLAHIRNMGYTINYYKEDINFFSEFDLRHFAKIAGQSFDHQDLNSQLDATFVRPLVAKLNKWAELAVMEGFEIKPDNTWQWNGNKFKDYLWIKIYRPGASRRIYFIVGVSSDQMNRNESGYLYVVLECQREKSQKVQVLTDEEIEHFDQCLTRSNYSERRITLDEISSYTWDDLIQVTSDFLYDHEALYDELENLVNNPGINPSIKTDPPEHTKTYANRPRNFIGGETDWGKKQSLTKALGNAGEDFVYKLERKKLIEHEIENYAELVQRKRDGEGYDILSADLNKNPIHIEVKTTARGEEEPFYFSLNEFEYLRLNPRNYFLYRLYNYVIEKNTCNYYVLTGLELLEWTFKEINFEVSKHSEIE